MTLGWLLNLAYLYLLYENKTEQNYNPIFPLDHVFSSRLTRIVLIKWDLSVMKTANSEVYFSILRPPHQLSHQEHKHNRFSVDGILFPHEVGARHTSIVATGALNPVDTN